MNNEFEKISQEELKKMMPGDVIYFCDNNKSSAIIKDISLWPNKFQVEFKTTKNLAWLYYTDQFFRKA